MHEIILFHSSRHRNIPITNRVTRPRGKLQTLNDQKALENFWRSAIWIGNTPAYTTLIREP